MEGYKRCEKHASYARHHERLRRVLGLDSNRLRRPLEQPGLERVKPLFEICAKCGDDHSEVEGCMERSPYPPLDIEEHTRVFGKVDDNHATAHGCAYSYGDIRGTRSESRIVTGGIR